MPENTHITKDAFFNSMKELEQQHAACTTKFQILDNVIRGKENVSFPVIDRCREALLQLRQSHHVFRTIFAQISDNPLASENMMRLVQMQEENDATAAKASSALSDILSWVPQAVNTRASSPVARAD